MRRACDERERLFRDRSEAEVSLSVLVNLPRVLELRQRTHASHFLFTNRDLATLSRIVLSQIRDLTTRINTFYGSLSVPLFA